MGTVAIGIDVQANRPCPFAVVDQFARMIDGGWLATEGIAESVQRLANQYNGAAFAIDAPRMALPKPRQWYWRKGTWTKQSGNEKGMGRHCEVVIAAHRLANPQWTPLAKDAPGWMKNGFRIFEAPKGRAPTFEVFPSASYKMFKEIARP